MCNKKFKTDVKDHGMSYHSGAEMYKDERFSNFELLIRNTARNILENQGKYFGRTEYLTPVIFDSNGCLPGEIVDVKIKSFNRNNLFGSHDIRKIKVA